jgi:endonuclease III
VDGVATVYACPTPAAVDAHLAELRNRIEWAHQLPKLQAQYREDCDRLLDRRRWLELQDED